MKNLDVNEKLLVSLIYAFLGTGACAYGCIFATYVLWYLGLVQ
jgi:hypothetical protein